MSVPVLTYKTTGPGHRVDLDRFIGSRALIQANSGGGKSQAIRQLLEETSGRVPHFVIDPEGEFATLREAYPYLLGAKTGGDFALSPKTAKLTCRRLVEIGASAVFDLYELPLLERREFVKLFLTELVNLPRSLWRPMIVVIDEAQMFAPERGHGEAQSTDAVISLCSLGRKRGLCAVLATQRISKLHKDAAAELLNKMIGRTGLDLDVKRAGDELGFDKETRQQLPRLEPGEFFVYGPAISPMVTLVKTGAVQTTHPQPGKVSAAPPPTPDSVKAMLAQLGDLPKEAEAEARTMADLERQVKQLRGDLRKAQQGATERVVERTVADPHAIARAVAAAVKPYQLAARNIGRAVDRVSSALEQFAPAVRAELVPLGLEAPVAPIAPMPTNRRVDSVRPVPMPRIPRASTGGGDGSLPKGERIVLTAIAQYPDGVERDQLSILTGFKRSTRDAYIQRLIGRGYAVLDARIGIVPTDAGVDALGDFEPLPTGSELYAYWMTRLPAGEAAVLEAIVTHGGDGISREAISETTSFKRSTRDAYIQRLKARKIVTQDGNDVRACDSLFD